MKKIFLTILLGISLSLTAQNTTLAKINFEAAEEAYNNSNYELALEKLSKAEEFFGQINLPILYLRVINQDKLLTQKPSFTLLQKLKSNCASFLSNYSNDTEAFEKIKEVYNIDEKWKTVKTEGDFDNYLKEFKVKEKRDLVISLAKEIEEDYKTAPKKTDYDRELIFKIKIDFINKSYLIETKNLRTNQYLTASLDDIREVQFTNSYIYIIHNNKTDLYRKRESIWTALGHRIKDKLLKLIELLKTVE